MQGRRRILIDSIAKRKGINKEVLEAMMKVPRHNFVPIGMEAHAYDDRALSISKGQTISQPTTVAIQTSLLEPKPDDIVLEIGTGSGYQSAILSLLVKKVYTIERIKELHESASSLLQELNYKNITTIYADGSDGANQYAPFDKIIITAAVSEIPQTLLNQLKIGGIIVAPVGSHKSTQIMQKIIKKSENKINIENHGLFSFVPFKKGIE